MYSEVIAPTISNIKTKVALTKIRNRLTLKPKFTSYPGPKSYGIKLLAEQIAKELHVTFVVQPTHGYYSFDFPTRTMYGVIPINYWELYWFLLNISLFLYNGIPLQNSFDFASKCFLYYQVETKKQRVRCVNFFGREFEKAMAS